MPYDKERYHSDPEYREHRLALRRKYYELRKKRDPKFLEHEAARVREARLALSEAERTAQYKRHRKPRTEAQKAAKAQRQREARAAAAEQRPPRVRAARAVKTPPKRAPSFIREAWSKSDPNSIIRRKYPSSEALRRGAERGDFDAIQAR